MASTELKVQIEKLEGADNWSKWKWHINMQFEQFELTSIVDGSRNRVGLPRGASEAERAEDAAWVRDNAKASSIIASALTRQVAELVLTCTTANQIWEKLCSRFERCSEQRLDLLMEQFYTFSRSEGDDIAAHVAKMQKIFADMNNELVRQGENTLSDKMLIGRIMSTLGSEFYEFRNVWEAMDRNERTINVLIEKLCSIELRSTKAVEVGAFTVKTPVGKAGRELTGRKNKWAVGKSKVERFPCKNCGKLGHWKASCTEPSRKNAQKTSSQTSKAFVVCEGNAAQGTEWICDSGATQHITANRDYLESYVPFKVPIPVNLANKQVMQAYGSGRVNVSMKVNGKYKEAYLDDVWYVPESGRNLLSVQRTAKHGHKIVMDNKKVTFYHNGEISATGQWSEGMYIMDMKVLIPDKAAEVNMVSVTDTLQVWHERMGHQNKSHIKEVLNQMNIETKPSNSEFCDGCALGKAHRLPFGTRTTRPKIVGEQINADVNGPMSIKSLGGARYFVCFKDDFSKFRRIFFIGHKSEVARCLSQFLNETDTMGHRVKVFLSDGGTEFNCDAVHKILSAYGITLRITMPYTPEQNGAAERENRTIVELARSMIAVSGLPRTLWAEACHTAVYILNRTGKTNIDGKPPLELWTGHTVYDLSHLRIFGTSCYVHTPKQRRKKWNDKSIQGNLVGYVDEKDGYRIYIPAKETVMCSRDVIFKPEQTCTNVTEFVAADPGLNSLHDEKNSKSDEGFENTEPVNQNHKIDAAVSQRQGERIRSEPAWKMSGDYVCLGETSDSVEMSGDVCLGETSDFVLNPTTFKDAMASPEKEKWYEAMKEELAAQQENNTWDLVDRPEGVKLIRNRWVLRVKTSPDGKEKYKARLVAKGYSQKPGIDYDEVFSPVARYDTVRTLLAVAASEGLKLRQFDIKTAFLNGILQEEVYMAQPEGFEDGSESVCHLKKSLYGLRQSPRCWNKRLRDFLRSLNFKCSEADPCLFVRYQNDKKLFIAVYVDDGLMAGSDDDEIDAFLDLLKEEFKCTSDSLNNYLGIQFVCHSDGTIFVNQESYTRRLLDRFRMSDSNAVSTPCDRSDNTDDKGNPLGVSIPYREAVGCLMHLVAGSRPDIAFAVGLIARKMENPTSSDWNSVKRILRYLKGTSDYGLAFKPGDKILRGYSDADYAGDKDTRKSTTGVVCTYAGCAVSWTSTLQKSVALSTTEAEFVAASEGAKELIWLNRLLGDLLQPVTTPTLFIDNASAIKLVKNPEFHKRSKHIEVRYFFVRERYQNDEMRVQHIDSENQLADVLTKPLQRVRFQVLRDSMGLRHL